MALSRLLKAYYTHVKLDSSCFCYKLTIYLKNVRDSRVTYAMFFIGS